jgi:hypothetical protein
VREERGVRKARRGAKKRGRDCTGGSLLHGLGEEWTPLDA